MPHNMPDNQNIRKVSPTESLMSTDPMHPRPFDTCQRISSHDATAWHGMSMCAQIRLCRNASVRRFEVAADGSSFYTDSDRVVAHIGRCANNGGFLAEAR